MTSAPPRAVLREGTLGPSPAAADALASRRRQLALLALALAVAYAIALLVPDLVRREPHQRSSLSKRGDGFYALVELARRLGHDVARHRATYGALPDPTGTVLAVLDPVPRHVRDDADSAGEDAGQARLLADWVRRGGHLVATLPSATVLRVLGVSLADPGDPPSLDADADPVAAVVASVPAARWAPARGALRGTLELGGFADRWEVPASAIAPAGGHLRAREHDEASEGGGAELRVFARAAAAGALRPIAWLADAPLVLRGEIGRGRVWLCSSALPFSNVGLGRLGTAPFAVALLQAASGAGRRRLLVDEYCHGLAQHKDAWWWVRHSALGYPVAAGLLLLLLLGWRGGHRLGAPAPVPQTPRRAREELVIGLAELARRASRHRAAAAGIAEGWRHRLRGRRGRSATAARRALAALEHRLESQTPFGQKELAVFAASAAACCADACRDAAPG